MFMLRTSSNGLNTIASSGDSAGDELLADSLVPASALAAARGANAGTLQARDGSSQFTIRASEQRGPGAISTFLATTHRLGMLTLAPARREVLATWDVKGET